MISLRRFGASLAAAAVVTGSLLSASIAPATASGSATVYAVHGVPGLKVDVYVDGTRILKDWTFGHVAGPLSLTPGRHTVAVRLYGHAGAPILQASPTVVAGENADVVAYLNAKGTPTLGAFANTTTGVPAAKAIVNVRHTADAPAVDVYAGMTKIFSNVTSGHGGSVIVAKGTYPVSIKLAGTMTTVLGPVSVKIQSHEGVVAYAIGSAAMHNLMVVAHTYMIS
jgi:Domain of unknown function (DUF4397)